MFSARPVQFIPTPCRKENIRTWNVTDYCSRCRWGLPTRFTVNIHRGVGCYCRTRCPVDPCFPRVMFSLGSDNNAFLSSTGKKKFQSEPWCCPVCGVTVRTTDLESHFVQELEKLYKLTGKVSTGRRPSTGCPSPRDRDPADGSLEGRWEVSRNFCLIISNNFIFVTQTFFYRSAVFLKRQIFLVGGYRGVLHFNNF